jgi:hypothetical protein
MKKSRFSAPQIAFVLKQAEDGTQFPKSVERPDLLPSHKRDRDNACPLRLSVDSHAAAA